jgi:hypothetical protein
MNTPADDTKQAAPEVPPKGFFAALLHRLDQGMKAAAEKKASQSCCGGSADKSGKGGGKCC